MNDRRKLIEYIEHRKALSLAPPRRRRKTPANAQPPPEPDRAVPEPRRVPSIAAPPPRQWKTPSNAIIQSMMAKIAPGQRWLSRTGTLIEITDTDDDLIIYIRISGPGRGHGRVRARSFLEGYTPAPKDEKEQDSEDQ